MTRRVIFAVGVAAVLLARPVPAATGLGAEQIVKAAYEHQSGAYANLRAAMKMTVTSAKGDQKIRDLEMMGMRTAGGLLATLTRFQGPADIAGTALLVLEQAEGPPEQYLYLSRFNKTRHLPRSDATVTFMGSDFTFLDLNPALFSTIKDVAYQRLPDAEVDGTPVFVVAIMPQVKGTPYSKLVVHVHQKLLVLLKVEFYDATGAPLKVMSLRNLTPVKVGKDTKMIPLESEMKHLQRGSSTVLKVEKIHADPALDPASFSPAALKKH